MKKKSILYKQKVKTIGLMYREETEKAIQTAKEIAV